ncbi:unnamed protein product [Ceratitis capitata]|uniref:(Mediterranean fruit fly) hypothetical protein n=1 Tax=Ceratitis capitata TaxID=7213 RepID=A0A811UL78_CERCA|nr:unnamed protein product [Ceratitis capitata]
MLTDFQELWPSSQKGVLPKPNKLQTINVIKICEKLSLAITQVCNGLQRTLDVARRSREELTFRSVSGLCYTTLRIHEVQVNNLLNKSKELVVQSRDWSTMQVKKRSQPSKCLVSYSSKKKRRATIEHTVQDVTITNYTQLLDETNKFVEWGKTAELANGKVSKANGHSRTTCIHIREITINELETCNEHYLYDEDDGFGSNTADELASFIHLLEDQPIGQKLLAKAPKRKAIEAAVVCEKKSKANADQLVVATLEEKPRSKKVVEASTLCEKKSKNIQSLQINTGQDVELPEIEVARCNASTNEVIGDFIPTINNCEKSNSHDFSSEPLNDISFDNVQKCNGPEVLVHDTANNGENISCNSYKAFPSSTPSIKRNIKSRNIIIDERLGLTEAEMREQLQARTNIPMKIRKFRAKIQWNSRNCLASTKHYERILPSAHELLTRLNRNCIAMRKFKVKNRVKRMNFESSNESTTFRNLLYAICNCEITDHLATQIYKNWNKVENPDTKVPYYNELTLSANNIISNEVNNNNLERVSKNSSSSDEQDEWSAYNIMIKLLNLWRTENIADDSIPVEYIFPQNKTSRKVAAKGFGVLLKLAAKNFIVLVSMEHTKHLQRIQLGAASVKLVQQSKLNGIAEKRVNNGYRAQGN